ncbi:MAG: DUF4340 domain-containing protein [Kiritimatiellae bacterium]|nr:DUF4340 domain-containing protein [Kiritimatiellia bacterium]
MTTKNLAILGAAAVVLGGVAWFCNSGRTVRAPSIVGERILPSFDISDVARIEIGGAKKVQLVADDKGWKIQSLYGYPADVTKIRENLLKLTELKVGQVANGKKLASPATVDIQNAAGKSLAALPLGETHNSKPKGQAAMYGGGGYPDGRYVEYKGKTVLVKETLDAFDGDPKKWTDTRIASVTASDVTAVTYSQGKEVVKLARKDSKWELEGLGPKEELDTSKTYSLDSALSYLDFTDVADPKKTEADLGFATGAVYTVVLKNGESYTAKVGGKNGSDRWVRLSASFKAVGTNATENAASEKKVKEFNDKVSRWTYAVSSYSADNMSKKRADLVKAKEEPKKDDAKKAEAKPAAPKPEVKKVEAPKPAAPKPEVKKAEAPKPAAPKAEAKPAAKADKK